MDPAIMEYAYSYHLSILRRMRHYGIAVGNKAAFMLKGGYWIGLCAACMFVNDLPTLGYTDINITLHGELDVYLLLIIRYFFSQLI